MTKIGKYLVRSTDTGVGIYIDDCCVGSIDGITVDILDEDTIDELLYGDIDEKNYWLS